MIGACNSIYFGPAAGVEGGGLKRSNIVKFQLQSKFLFFISNCVCSHKKRKHINISNVISFYRLGHALGVGLGSASASTI